MSEESPSQSPQQSPAPPSPQTDPQSSSLPPVLTPVTPPQSPAQSSQPPKPAEVFVPRDLSYDGLMYFAAWLQDQGKITNEQFNYLHKTAQQYRKTQEELSQSYQRMETARKALEVPERQTVVAPQANPAAPSQTEQLVNLMTALAAAAQQPREEPHSYLIRKGDQEEIEEMKSREEAARKSGLVGTTGTVSTAPPVSREEMERQRRERYEQLQRSNEEAAKRKEEAERRARALDAMWRNDGSSSIGKP